jgi:choline dehydrogenase-like flavoprotein
MRGATANTLLVAGGMRITAADAWLDDAAGRPNLRILTDATVETILLAEPPLRAVGVRLRTATGVAEIRAGAVVLAAGAIGSPLILMRSGVGDPAVLAAAGITPRHTLGEVGRNLADHVLAAGAVYATAMPPPPSRLQHSEALLYAGRGSDPWADASPDLVVACVVAPAVAAGLPRPDRPALSLLFGITHPASRGTLRPVSPDPADAPSIDPAYLAAAADREGMRDALALARRLATTAPLADALAGELLPGSAVTGRDAIDDFVARALVTHHHPAGTCRMGRDAGAVVRPDLSVAGVGGLFVADASVFPALPSGPINAAVAALAETFAARFGISRPA